VAGTRPGPRTEFLHLAPGDRRRHLVELTEDGRGALVDAEQAQETIEDDVLRTLDPEERAILWQLLTRALQGAELDKDDDYSATTASIST